MSRLYFLSALLACSICWSSQTITYQSSLEGKDSQTEWKIADEESKIAISGFSKGNDIQLEYSPSFNLEHYVETDPSSHLFEIYKSGNILEVKNKAKSKSLKLGNLPWIQEFKFGFQPFLKSSNQEQSFAIVYSKDTTIHEMVATKEIIESIVVDGKPYQAQKLKVTLKGFKKRFWKAEAWFDVETNLMVKYRSNEGPGTPHIEVTLIDRLPNV